MQWHPTPVLLPGRSHGRRSLVGCSPWGRKEADMTERLHFRFSLSCIIEGTGNSLQCSCLENPRDGGAWWAAIYGVAQSRTRLKRLSPAAALLKGALFRFSCIGNHQKISLKYRFCLVGLTSSQLPLCHWLRSGPVKQTYAQRGQRERQEEIKETVGTEWRTQNQGVFRGNKC